MKKIVLLTLLLTTVANAQTKTFPSYVGGLPFASSIGTSDTFYLLQGGVSKQAQFQLVSPSFAAIPHQWVNAIFGGSVGSAQPAFTDISGTATVLQGGTGVTTFTSNLPLIGNGSSPIAQGSISGNTTKFITAAAGSLTGCATFDVTGNLTSTGLNCGNAGATLPGGSVNGEVQYKNGSSFAGDTGLSYSGTGATGTLTVGTGLVIANPSGNAGAIAIGSGAMPSNVNAHNVAIGNNALNANTNGNFNVAVGSFALSGNTSTRYNVAVGYQAAQTVTKTEGNVAVGYQAGINIAGDSSLGQGTNNVAIGWQALTGGAGFTGTDNVAIAQQTLAANTAGTNNTAIGSFAMQSNTTGVGNVAIGPNALNKSVSGAGNVAIGNAALDTMTSQGSMVAIGNQALTHFNGSLNDSVAIGFQALGSATTGNTNTAVGYQAAAAVTSGSFNTAFGMQALGSETTGSNNDAFGYEAVFTATSGHDNVGFGHFSVGSVVTGVNNSGLGSAAMTNLTGGSSDNTVIGAFAMPGNTIVSTIGSGNTVVGSQAVNSAFGLTEGQETAMGYRALFDLNGAGNGNNVAIGYNTGRGVVTGQNNTILGSNVSGLLAGLTGAIILAIGDGTIKGDWNKTNSGAWTFAGGVSCAAGTVSLTTFTVSGGLVTHC